MKHICDCGEIVEAEGSPLIATCPHCGSYYLYPEQVRTPTETTKPEVSDVYTLQTETEVIQENIPVKPRAAKRR